MSFENEEAIEKNNVNERTPLINKPTNSVVRLQEPVQYELVTGELYISLLFFSLVAKTRNI